MIIIDPQETNYKQIKRGGNNICKANRNLEESFDVGGHTKIKDKTQSIRMKGER